jgi:hypothetical protein
MTYRVQISMDDGRILTVKIDKPASNAQDLSRCELLLRATAISSTNTYYFDKPTRGIAQLHPVQCRAARSVREYKHRRSVFCFANYAQ